ncbi:MAG TPA: hypothetical protein VMF66_05810 [Candidatus Acidoferrum sp.]|nr:hypothetical protein [Candidatus Acidoferrum sp.]
MFSRCGQSVAGPGVAGAGVTIGELRDLMVPVRWIGKRRGFGEVTAGDEHFPAGLGPAAIVVETTESADGTNDVASGWNDAAGLFHELSQDVTRFRDTLLEEAKGASVAVHGQAAPEVELKGNAGGRLPVEDGLVDGFAIGVIADRAASLMVLDAWLRAAAEVPGGSFGRVRFPQIGWCESSSWPEAGIGGQGHRGINFPLGMGIEPVELVDLFELIDLIGGCFRVGFLLRRENLSNHVCFLSLSGLWGVLVDGRGEVRIRIGCDFRRDEIFARLSESWDMRPGRNWVRLLLDNRLVLVVLDLVRLRDVYGRGSGCKYL